jgi:hypothetical protein
LLLGALGSSGLGAQGDSPYPLVFKVRAGIHAGDLQKAHFDNKLMGFGVEYKREMFANGGALLAEIAWEIVPGRHKDVYPYDYLDFYGNPLWLNSYDNRKEYGQGFNLRLGYSAPLPMNNFEWFAGLCIDRFKVRTEVKYTLLFDGSEDTTTIGQYDGASFAVEGAQLVPGFFAGVKYRINEDMNFEMSLRNFGMRRYEYVSELYELEASGQNEYNRPYEGISKTSTARGWALEFALSLKF